MKIWLAEVQNSTLCFFFLSWKGWWRHKDKLTDITAYILIRPRVQLKKRVNDLANTSVLPHRIIVECCSVCWIVKTLNNTALHCTAVHCTALHCAALQCTELIFLFHFTQERKGDSLILSHPHYCVTCKIPGWVKSGLYFLLHCPLSSGKQCRAILLQTCVVQCSVVCCSEVQFSIVQ